MNKWHTDIGFHIPKLSLLEVWPLNTFIGNKNNLTVIDVGGNVGLWCQAFMNTFGKQVDQYHAFEPLDGNIRIFSERVADGMICHNEKINIHKTCVGPTDGEVQIRYHNNVSAVASVVLEEMKVGNQIIRNDRVLTRQQITLDTFHQENELSKIDLIKIDVEGYEWEVLLGAKELISSKKVNMVLFEFGQHQGTLGQSFAQFWELFSKYGYHIYRQAVGRNFFGLQFIESYDRSLEQFDSMWMVLASRNKHFDELNKPFVIGRYRAQDRRVNPVVLFPLKRYWVKKINGLKKLFHKLTLPKMIPQNEIDHIYLKVWKQGYKSISAREAGFIQNVIIQRKPKRFLEVGTASGISTGFIAKFMSRNGGEELVSLDLEKIFWVDRSKPTGFLAKEIYHGDQIKLTILQEKDSTFVSEAYDDNKFDAAFIDAQHQHPWPTLDTIAVLPFLNKMAVIIYHDLALYRMQTPVFGIGPKYLYDQIHKNLKVVTSDPKKNIFYIKTTDNYSDYEEALLSSLYIPWSIRNPIPAATVGKLRTIVEMHWGTRLLRAFDDSVLKFNKP